MKVVVTGCTGKVGLRVVLHVLSQGHWVRGLDIAELTGTSDDDQYVKGHERFSFLRTDLKEYDRVLGTLEGWDAIIHLAGFPNPSDGIAAAHNSNVVISWNILRSAAELGITRIALASSVNAIGLVYNQSRTFDYFPIDEFHPCRPDEPYGLSKQIMEMQADTIVRRYPNMRIASLRLSWAVPKRAASLAGSGWSRANDLWGYVQEDSAAEAFLLAVIAEEGSWTGHEVFFIAAPHVSSEDDFQTLRKEYPDVPVKEGQWSGFFDCRKAERMLGWVHRD